MNFNEGVQKVNFPIVEPHLYVKPPLNYVPIEQVNKVYSNENFFNQNAFKEFKEKQNKSESKKNTVYKGAILDVLS